MLKPIEHCLRIVLNKDLYIYFIIYQSRFKGVFTVNKIGLSKKI
jgi:hypothetical protein